jgi:hypothetical protein
MRSKLVFLFSIGLFTIIVLLHQDIAHQMIESGFSWTFSYLLPYFIAVAFIIGMAISFSQFITERRAYQRLIGVSLALVSGGVGFGLNPIYEGDFTNNMREIHLNGNSQLFPEGITMVALPGCKFCYGQIPTLITLKKRNPDVPITVLFLIAEPLSMEDYREQLGEGIAVITASTPSLISEIVDGKFPCYIFFSASSPNVYKWSLDGLGAFGLDHLERLAQQNSSQND